MGKAYLLRESLARVEWNCHRGAARAFEAEAKADPKNIVAS